jgi:hypothetical protein
LTLDEHRIDTIFDLDRSNSLPDIVSTLALAAGSVAAALLAVRERAGIRVVSSLLAGVLALLTLADLLHDGAHPTRQTGLLVIALVVTAGGLLIAVAVRAAVVARALLAGAALALLVAFMIPGLDQYDRWFQRERGDPVREYQVVAKEDLELVGWSLVAVALWCEVARRRPKAQKSGTPRASRGRPAPGGHVA